MLGKVKKSTSWLTGLLAAGLVGTTTTAILAIRSTAPKANITNQTVAVVSRDLMIQIKANGLVQALRKINLSPKEAGRIDQLYVDEGDWVDQGKLVARMESEQFQAQVNQYKAALTKAQADLAQKRSGSRSEEIAQANAKVAAAQANVAQAQAKLNRATEELKHNQYLAQQGAISLNSLEELLSNKREAKANLDAEVAHFQEQTENLQQLRNGTRKEEIAQAEAEVAQATAQLRYYQTQLENTIIRAPFAGTITRRFAQKGDFVTPTTAASTSDGATSTSVAELSSGLEVEAKVPEASMARIKPGQQVEIRSDTYPEDIFQGRVRLVAPRAVQENNVTSFRVKVALNTGQDKLKSGMNVKSTFLVDKIQKAMVLPLAVIVTKKDGQTGVLVLEKDNQAKFRPVSLGSTSADQVQILSGVAKGERILISPPTDQTIPGIDTSGD